MSASPDSENIKNLIKIFFKESSKEKMFNNFASIFSIITAISASLIMIIMNSFPSNYSDEKYFNKETFKKTLTVAIKNNAEIDNIKHIYDARTLETRSLFSKNEEFLSKYYIENTSLSFILNDLLSDYYTNNNFKADSSYLQNLKLIIKENEEINPFDKLEVSQKYNFENIRQKSDSNYIKIQSDVIRIADELDSKNQLVSKYLNQSENSFNLSIIALIVTILLSAYQIYQNFSSSKKIQKFISKFTEDNNKDENNKA